MISCLSLSSYSFCGKIALKKYRRCVKRDCIKRPQVLSAAKKDGFGLRVFVLSDLHTDYPENMEWVRNLSTKRHDKDVLLVAGDVAETYDNFVLTMSLLKERFEYVFFVPGNHDLWSRWETEDLDSLEKLNKLLDACKQLGVETNPVVIDGLGIIPLFSWYHESFDKEDDITGVRIPSLDLACKDFHACKWPGNLSNRDTSLSLYFDTMNEKNQNTVKQIQRTCSQIITFSHFVPRQELCPEKRMLFYPNLPKIIGSDWLEDRIRSIHGVESSSFACHVFGHTHFCWDAIVDGIRYVQAPLAYPRERKRRMNGHGGETWLPFCIYSDGDFAAKVMPCYWSDYYASFEPSDHLLLIRDDKIGRYSNSQDMGCLVSTPKDSGGNRRRPTNIGEVSVYVPGLRTPKPVDFSQSLGGHLSKTLVERHNALRTRIVVMAGQEATTITRTRRKTATQHGGSALADLHQALEDYLPVLLGLVSDGSQLQFKVQFIWVNQEDDAEETAMFNAWYEVLSVLHLMAVLSLSQANLLLLPRTSDSHQPKVSEERRRASIDIFLKAAGYLDCAVRHVLPQLPSELRRNLPVDLAEGVLRALCLQALGQCVEIQLGMAIDSIKATLAVKRRLACEMVKYWQQAQDNIMNLPLSNGWGEKHRLFVKWKYVEAKAAAYYYHGLILDEGNTEKSHGMAVAALQAADKYFEESKRACEVFNAAHPLSRNPPLWGTMKYLSEKIPKDTCSKVRINRDLYSHEKIMGTAPTLPDFPLALKPDEYQLPPVDGSWNEILQLSQNGINEVKPDKG
ncbi:hypothetical protein V6N13_077546 [Hibiscus sabdariffa]